MKFNQDVTTIPTVGFNVETVQIEKVKFNVWDVGGQDKIRPLWRHYYTGTQGLIFVVDSSDRARIEEARQELKRILGDKEMEDALLLIFANKQDVPGAMKANEIIEKLKLSEFKRRTYHTQESIATTGDGLVDGLVSNWIDQVLCGGITCMLTYLRRNGFRSMPKIRRNSLRRT